MIRAKGIGFSYTSSTHLFRDASFVVGKGQKVGIVGANGAGKSTLLKIVREEEEPSSGRIEVQGSIGYVPQEVKHDPDLESAKTVRDYITQDSSIQDHEIMKMLSGLELKHVRLGDPPKKMSGGQKTKLALCRALMAEPEILLLDEPTNFMDVEGKKFVMDFLGSYPKTLLMISHDIELMGENIDKILEVNSQTKEIDVYKGNYESFLKLKKERKRILEKQIQIESQKIRKMQKSLTKVSRYSSAKGVRVKTRMRHKFEEAKANLPELPPEVKSIHMKLPTPARVGELPIRVKEIKKSFDDKEVLQGVDLTLHRGEKVALIGHNGAGKSTLIKIIMDKLDADAGEIILDSEVKIGYYSQEFENIDMDRRVLDFASEVTKYDERRVRGLLAKFLFDSEKVKRKIQNLSGGEKTRLSIALLVSTDNNVLILDEPTTYLDVLSQRVILEALKMYEGAMLLVSHTEQFVKEIEPDRALILPDNKIRFWSNDLLDRVGEI